MKRSFGGGDGSFRRTTRPGRRLPVSIAWIESRLKDAAWVAKARERLQSLSWFMKCLKEPLSRLANHQEQTRGAFFEGRFKTKEKRTGIVVLTRRIGLDSLYGSSEEIHP